MRNFDHDFDTVSPWLNAPWHDALTGALTRQHFLDLLAEECAHVNQTAVPCVVFIADVDGLKEVNERCGHRDGDTVLVAASQRLRELLGRNPWHNFDTCFARFDGDAFMLLARECRMDHGYRLAEAFRQRISSSPVVDQISITVSIGVAEYRGSESVDALIARTERAVHLAKQFGPAGLETAEAAVARPLRSNVVPFRRQAGRPF